MQIRLLACFVILVNLASFHLTNYIGLSPRGLPNLRTVTCPN